MTDDLQDFSHSVFAIAICKIGRLRKLLPNDKHLDSRRGVTKKLHLTCWTSCCFFDNKRTVFFFKSLKLKSEKHSWTWFCNRWGSGFTRPIETWTGRSLKSFPTWRACVSVIHLVTLDHEGDSVIGHILIYLLPSAWRCCGCREWSRENRTGTAPGLN